MTTCELFNFCFCVFQASTSSTLAAEKTLLRGRSTGYWVTLDTSKPRIAQRKGFRLSLVCFENGTTSHDVILIDVMIYFIFLKNYDKNCSCTLVFK